MIINEIADYVRFLRKEGYKIYIALSEEFSEDTRKVLSEFLPDENAEDKMITRSVFFDDMEVAKISADKEEYVAALSSPLKYMIERLHEESDKQISETNEHDIYRKALQYIKEHYTEGITVADVSKHINYSESYFGYAFKKKYKMTVSQYVRELQLAKAKNLLENTSFSVSSVATYVGFDDFTYFSALFKKYFGLSPKEYRKKRSTLV